MFRIFASGDVFIVVLVGVLAFALGFWGFWDCSFTFVPDPADASQESPVLLQGRRSAICKTRGTSSSPLSISCAAAAISRCSGKPPMPPDPWQLVIAQVAMPGIAIFAAIGATLEGVLQQGTARPSHHDGRPRRRTTSSFAGSALPRCRSMQNLHDLKKNRGLVVIDPDRLGDQRGDLREAGHSGDYG